MKNELYSHFLVFKTYIKKKIFSLNLLDNKNKNKS
jgi:hypothetical protein